MGTIYRRNRTWWIGWKDPDEGWQYESSRSTKQRDAKALLRKREGRIAEGKDPGISYEKVTLQELADGLLTDYRVNGKRSYDRVERSVRYLLKFFGRNARAVGVTGALVQEYVLERKNTPSKLGGMIKNATINRELAALKRMYNLAVKNGKLAKSHVPYIKSLKERNIREGFFSHQESLELLDVLPAFLRPLATTAYYTGMRKNELLSLTWGQIDLDDGQIILRADDTKNEQPRKIPLYGELREVLEEHKSNRDRDFPDCSWVFFTPEGNRITSFRRAWERACKEAGCPGRFFHDFRRTAIRNLVRAGVPEKVAMEISGHKTRSVFERYNIVSEEDKEQAMRKLDRYLRPSEEKIKVFRRV